MHEKRKIELNTTSSLNKYFYTTNKARVKCWGKIDGEKDRITLLPVKNQNIRIRHNLPSKQTITEMLTLYFYYLKLIYNNSYN